MTAFRLERLVRLREREEREEKLRWAAALQGVFEARETRQAGVAELRRAHDELSAAPGAALSPARRLVAEGTLDRLGDRKAAQEQAVQEALRLADEARAPYDQRRREAEALRRLEERWVADRRKRRRRRDERTRQEHIARQGGTQR